MPRKPKISTASTPVEATVIEAKAGKAPVDAPPDLVAATPKKRAKAPPKLPTKPVARKASSSTVVPAEPTTEQVAQEAYLLWLGEGMPQGKDMEHWLIAEQIVRSRLSLLAAAVHTA
ncbi:DUF2934 domain-containing protein [Niveispirillum irakense]|uniref:DUF2934 domain-containing protein n=1 Tax=Niveispirillum irakense TaxID=34011 RepID=UPI00042749C8|nr:DUF2934 domain-containing protein [Niveispirillum irakense]